MSVNRMSSAIGLLGSPTTDETSSPFIVTNDNSSLFPFLSSLFAGPSAAVPGSQGTTASPASSTDPAWYVKLAQYAGIGLLGIVLVGIGIFVLLKD